MILVNREQAPTTTSSSNTLTLSHTVPLSSARPGYLVVCPASYRVDSLLTYVGGAEAYGERKDARLAVDTLTGQTRLVHRLNADTHLVLPSQVSGVQVSRCVFDVD